MAPGRPILITVLFALGTLSALPRAIAEDAWYQESRRLYYGIPVMVRFQPEVKPTAARVWSYLESIDGIFNDYRLDSEVSRLNHADRRQDVALSADLAQAMRLSMALVRQTEGACDVTVGQLVRLWKSAVPRGIPPTQAQIAGALQRRGFAGVRLTGDRLRVETPGLLFDFGGVVKGMAVDGAIALLRSGGAKSGLVQIGGETAAFGLSQRARPHVIGVQHPEDPERIWTSIVDPGTGLACSTSGNYNHPIVIGSRPYYHIVDPRTGQPVDIHTLSVTVAFPETGKNALADGLTKAGAVLGPKKALPLIEKLGGQALILVKAKNHIEEYKTSGWDRLVFR